MSLNLIDAAKGLFTNELVNKAGSFLGENENGVSKAFSAIIPTLLSSLLNKTSTGRSGFRYGNKIRCF